MSPNEALAFLDSIIAQAPLPRQAHIRAMNARNVLSNLIYSEENVVRISDQEENPDGSTE